MRGAERSATPLWLSFTHDLGSVRQVEPFCGGLAVTLGLLQRRSLRKGTLSGLAYIQRLKRWRRSGYDIEIIYLKVSDVRLCLTRIADRVRSGGHDIPETDARRRFIRSWRNFQKHYKLLADHA